MRTLSEFPFCDFCGSLDHHDSYHQDIYAFFQSLAVASKVPLSQVIHEYLHTNMGLKITLLHNKLGRLISWRYQWDDQTFIENFKLKYKQHHAIERKIDKVDREILMATLNINSEKTKLKNLEFGLDHWKNQLKILIDLKYRELYSTGMKELITFLKYRKCNLSLKNHKATFTYAVGTETKIIFFKQLKKRSSVNTITFSGDLTNKDYTLLYKYGLKVIQ